jgi:hypothetical protein
VGFGYDGWQLGGRPTGSSCIIACAFWLYVSTMLSQDARAQGSRGEDTLPLLYGVKLDGSQIAIDVASFGCTDASYFFVQLDAASADTFRLSVIAQKQDLCRMRAHIVTLTLDLPRVANLAGAKVIVMNKFAMPGALPRA